MSEELKADELERARLYREAQSEAVDEQVRGELVGLGFNAAMTALKERAAKEAGITVEEAEKLGEAMLAEEARQMSPGRRRLLRAGVGERHIKHIADVPPVDCEPLQAVKEFMANESQWCLVLAGGKGTRKTGSACWALTQGEGMFFEAPDLLGIAIENKPKFERITKARLVVIDDLGTERQDDKGVWLGTFADLWNKLYAADAKVIVTGNLFPKDVYDPKDPTKLQWPGFARIYGERVADRFREGGWWRQIKGESIRRKA